MRSGSEGSGEGEGFSSLRAFAHSSSLHGISHVFAYGAVSLRRVLWGAFFLGSLGLLLLVCAERVAYFLTYPHVTKLDEVAAHNLTFPAITICNLNEFRFSKITRNDMYHVGELLALLNDRYEISNPQLAEPHVLAALRDKANFKNFKAKPFSMAEFYNRTGHDLSDMLLQCSFRGVNCTAHNFTVSSSRMSGQAAMAAEPPGPGAGAQEAATFTSFARSCTLHGLGRIFVPGAPAPRRLLWAGAFLASLGTFLLQAGQRVRHYAAYPRITALDEAQSRVLIFPAITLCNYNRIRRSQLTLNDLFWLGGDLLAVGTEDFPRYLHALGRTPNLDGFFPSKSYDLGAFYQRAGHPIHEMLLRCRFRGRDCGPENFTTIFTRLGKCYTFNSGGPGREVLTTLQGGAGNGLELMLNVQQEEYLPVWGDTDETSYEAGVKVQIHSQEEPPFIDQLGFGVAPGFQTFVSCQQQRLVYLPPPWGDCKATPIESDFFTNYSITACRLDCETRYLAENCNCRMVHMPGNANVCTPEQYKECADPALDFLVKKDSDYCACRTPCAMVRYGKELSMVKIPSKASARYLAKKFNKTEQYIADNVLVLDIFFEALNYEMIEQKKAYEVAGLLGDIGGQMGLFIGASLLTILEIFDYLYEVFRDKLLSFYKEKKKTPRSDSSTLGACAPLRCHTDSLTFAPNMLPRHPALGPFEEFAC